MKGELSVGAGIVTMITSMMGMGINFMPCAFRYVDIGYGCVSGIIFIAMVGVFTFFSLYLISIAASRSKNPVPSYSSLSASISRILKVMVDVSVFCCCFGTNISFYRYLADLILDVFPGLVTVAYGREIARKIVVSTLAIPFFFLAAQKNLSNLKITSYITVASVAYLVVLMGAYSIFIGEKCARNPIGKMEPKISDGVPYFILGMACQTNMVKVYTELENKSKQSIFKVAFGAAFFGTLIYGLVGVCGYIVFGRSVDSSIIDSLIDLESPINKYLVTNTFDKYALTSRAACIGAMLVLFGGFPVQLNPISGILVSYFSGENSNESRMRVRMTFILIVALLSLALIENFNIDTVLKLVSATAINLISFFYPPVYYIYSGGKADVMVILSGLMAAMSVGTMCYMTYNILK